MDVVAEVGIGSRVAAPVLVGPELVSLWKVFHSFVKVVGVSPIAKGGLMESPVLIGLGFILSIVVSVLVVPFFGRVPVPGTSVVLALLIPVVVVFIPSILVPVLSRVPPLIILIPGVAFVVVTVFVVVRVIFVFTIMVFPRPVFGEVLVCHKIVFVGGVVIAAMLMFVLVVAVLVMFIVVRVFVLVVIISFIIP